MPDREDNPPDSKGDPIAEALARTGPDALRIRITAGLAEARSGTLAEGTGAAAIRRAFATARNLS